ncbi:TPA: CopD family protein [Neisseria meningitidis]
MMFSWFKLFHLFFVISWFAGLFYLPRIFVNMAMIDVPRGNPEYVRLSGMAVRLYRFMSPLGFGAVVFGAAIPFAAGWWGSGWVHVKLCLGLMLLAYQLYCGVLLRRFQDCSNAFSHRWYRVFNEIPVLLMVAALYLVVFKPF